MIAQIVARYAGKFRAVAYKKSARGDIDIAGFDIYA